MIQFDKTPSKFTNRVVVITGTVDPGVTALAYGADLSSLSTLLLTNHRFKAVLELTPGRNEFVFVPSVSSAQMPVRKVFYYEENPVSHVKARNSLDLHGEALGIDRAVGERNANYKTRLLQAAKAADPRDVPALLAATECFQELSLDAIRIKVQRTTYNHAKVTNPWVRVTLDNLEFTCDELRTEEGPVVFDRGYPYITPASQVAPFGKMELFTAAGERVRADHFSYDADTNRVWLKDEELYDEDLVLKYQTVVQYALSSDIATLSGALTAGGYISLVMTATTAHTTATNSSWIMPRAWTQIETREDYPSGVVLEQPGVYLSVSEVKTYALHEFRDQFLINRSGLGTKLEKFVQQIRSIDHRTWPRMVFGRDGLRDENFIPLQDNLPHLTDPERGYWQAGPTLVSAGFTELNIHEVTYLGGGPKDPVNPYKGILSHEWQSGVGHMVDLEPSVVAKEAETYADVVEESKIPVNILYGTL